MTNYNERLDEKIIDWWQHNVPFVTLGQKWEKNAQKNLADFIRSQQKELVAEAKPSKKYVGDEVAENRSYTGERLFNATIDEFEQNLLKALEDKK